MKRRPARPLVGKFGTQFLRRVWRECDEDNVLGLAAQMSFFFVLALFPFFIFLAALLGSLPFTNLWSRVLSWIILYLPHSSQNLVFGTVAGLTRGRQRFLSVGLLSSVWAACGGLLNLMSALNIAYEVRETRPAWLRLIISFLMLLVLALLFLASFGLLDGGDWIAAWMAGHVDRAAPSIRLLGAIRWAISVPLMAVGLTILDSVLPNVPFRWRWARPGTLFAAALWIPVTFGFNFYAQDVSPYDKTYGTLGAFMVLIVWIYLTSLITLVGAEINAELHKLSLVKAGAATGEG